VNAELSAIAALVAMEDGHSVATMKRTYLAWTKGAKPEDVELIKAAMAGSARNGAAGTEKIETPSKSPGADTRLPPAAQIESFCVSRGGPDAASPAAPTRCYGREETPESTSEEWLGWQDSNLRMAGSKPRLAINKIINLLISVRRGRPLEYPRIPFAATKAATRLAARRGLQRSDTDAEAQDH
jgi:hypothetical protein